MIRLLTICFALWALLASSLVAQPFSCAPLKADSAEEDINALMANEDEVYLTQSGARSVFGRDGGLLADGIIGPVTTERIGLLCDLVPLPPATPAVSGTVDVSQEFGRILKFRKGAQLNLTDVSLVTGGISGDYGRRTVRLGMSAASAAAALDGIYADERGGCADLTLASYEPPASLNMDYVNEAIIELTRYDPQLVSVTPPRNDPEFGPASRAAARNICSIYPTKGDAGDGVSDADDFLFAMEDLGQILSVRPDAVLTLSSQDFGLYVAANSVSRIARLLGPPPAVIELLREYANSAVAEPAKEPKAEVDLNASCPRGLNLTNVEYWSLTKEDIEALKARATVKATLKPELEKRFDTSEALVSSVSEVLKIIPGSCAEFRLQHILAAKADDTQVFALDLQKAKDLVLEPEFADLVPALEELAGAEAGASEQLQKGVEAKIDDATEGAIDKAIDKAVAAAAAAAEDVSFPADTAAAGLPKEAAKDPKPAQELAITDQSIALLKKEVENPELLKAIETVSTAALPSREDVAEMVKEALVPLEPGLNETARKAAIARIDTADLVSEKFRLTPEIIEALANAPEFAALTDTSEQALLQLEGIEYPTERLFNTAITAAFPLSVPEEDRVALLTTAGKTVKSGPRVVEAFGTDCGCAQQFGENALVYAFYPFWLGDLEPVGKPTPLKEGEKQPPPPTMAGIDYELIGRVAYDGLLIDGYEKGAERVVQNKARWLDAAPNFVISAHKHQTRVDLSIRLRGWENWEQVDRDAIASEIKTLMAPVELPDDSGAKFWLERKLDSFLSKSPDGLTLVLEPRPGAPAGAPLPDLAKLAALVKAIQGELPSPNMTINLAMDLDFLDNKGDGAYSAMEALKDILPGGSEQRIDKLLLFIERPTTKSKKILRQVAEVIYHGIDRVDLLRNIIPIVPQGAHASVPSSQSDEPYAQFEDDVIYFQDNFGGIGFWWLPDFDKNSKVRKIVEEKFSDVERFQEDRAEIQRTQVVKAVKKFVQPVCRITCPARYVSYFAMIVTLVLIGVVVWVSLYNGFVNRMVKRFFVVPLMFLFILSLLMLTQLCDTPPLYWALWCFILLSLLIIGFAAMVAYQRRVDGPLP